MIKYVNQKKIMSTSLLKKDEFVASEISGEVYRVVDIIHKDVDILKLQNHNDPSDIVYAILADDRGTRYLQQLLGGYENGITMSIIESEIPTDGLYSTDGPYFTDSRPNLAMYYISSGDFTEYLKFLK